MTSNSESSAAETVIIVGAGPVGLFTALLLAQNGIHVTVLERESAVIESPRAVGYMSTTMQEFGKAGILKDLEDQAYQGTKGVAWRGPASPKTMALISPPIGPHLPYFSLFIGQHSLCMIILERLAKFEHVQILWNHTFDSLKQTETGVTATFEAGTGKTKVELKSKFLVAADGGKSTVRRVLNIPLEGFTWENLSFIGTNIVYDIAKYGWPEVNYIVDPENWGIVLRAGKRENFWRVAFGLKRENAVDEKPLDNEALLKIAREKFQTLLPGPTEDAVIENVGTYVTHQRCAAKYVVGNVILAGDAAHLNSPIGALGLTTGILDAAALSRSIIKIFKDGEEVQSTLQDYETSRRDAFLSYTNVISTENLKRISANDEQSTKEREYHFKMLNEGNIPYIVGEMEREKKISTTL